MTRAEVDILVATCCCWFDFDSTAPWDATARAKLKKVLLQLDYAETEEALLDQSIWGQKRPSALKKPEVFSMLHERVKWARRRRAR